MLLFVSAALSIVWITLLACKLYPVLQMIRARSGKI
jgi:hypothetical protein